MAEKGFTPVRALPVFKDTSLSAGDAGTSDAVDIRYEAQNGYFALRTTVAAGTSTTAGTTVFTYSLASYLGGTYVTPSSAVAIGTAGPTLGGDIFTFEPELSGFMKVIATQSGTGTAGANSKITSELIVQ